MNLTRRFFLKTTGALAVYSGICPSNLLAGSGVQSSAVRRGKTLVILFLRGGADGLNLVVPHAEPRYYDLRKSIAIPRPGAKDGALDLDGFFGLHPAAAALLPMFQSGSALAIHAVGYAKNTRSHFEEQDVWETGVIGNTLNSDGWLNRHLLTSEGNGPVRAVAMSDSLPRILRGDAPAYAVRGISDLTLPEDGEEGLVLGAALEHAYCSNPEQHTSAARDLLVQTGGATLEGVKMIQAIAERPYKPAAEYPNSGLAKRLQEAARLIKADVGVEVVEIDYGGWDTHNRQGSVQGGAFTGLVSGMGDALAAFARDLGDHLNDTLILTLSDFGRTAAENGTQGTDHGWANCMLALGGPVRPAAGTASAPVIGKWPGLESSQLHEKRDLLHTTDFRDVLAEVVGRHLGNPNLEKLLPGHSFQPVGVVRQA